MEITKSTWKHVRNVIKPVNDIVVSGTFHSTQHQTQPPIAYIGVLYKTFSFIVTRQKYLKHILRSKCIEKKKTVLSALSSNTDFIAETAFP